MTPLIPYSDPVAMPGPLWLMHFLLLLTFTLHLIPMSFALGGGLLGAFSAIRGRRDERQHRLSEVIFRALPSATAFAITTGVAPLLFLQVAYGPVFYTSSVLMAWPWLAVVPLLILGYYGYYACALAAGPLGARRPRVALASAVAFVAVAALWVQNVLLMLSPDRWLAMHSQGVSGLHLNLSDPTFWPRLGHMALGAIAVSGVWLAILSYGQRRADPEFAAWMRRYGVRCFTGATLVNAALGLWLLLSLPAQPRHLFSGGMTSTTLLLTIGIVLAVAALGLIRVHPGLGAAALVGTLALMAVVRHEVRLAYLAPHAYPGALPTNPQWGPFALFAVLLAVGLAVVGWMTFVFIKAPEKPAPSEADKPAVL